MKKFLLFLTISLISLQALAGERTYLWPKGKMPDAQPHQIAAMKIDATAEGFNPDKNRLPYIEWMEAPAKDKRTDVCAILISGGGYNNLYDHKYIQTWSKRLSEEGVQCVNLVYRTPRSEGIPYYQAAWEDGQRAVRLVRKAAARKGFNPDKIGVVGMSAGSHLSLLLGTSSQTRAYDRIDATDDIPCNVNFAIVHAPAYVTTDGENGTEAIRDGYGPDVKLSSVFKFDEKTCPMSLHHGGIDVYSPNGSTQVYRQLRRMGIPAELHIYPDKPHGMFGFERAVEFLRQMGWLKSLGPEVAVMDRYPSDNARGEYLKEDIWPEGKTPDFQANQNVPYIEWHFPKNLNTKAIQIIYSGGGYTRNNPDTYEVAPVRRFLNEKGMTVVTLKYRSPRPEGLPKHITAWQDLQRTIRIVRSRAASYGLDPDRIGIMGFSAGGHLTLMGVTSARHHSYKCRKGDPVDSVSCKVQWGVAVYPAYALTDGLEKSNATGGNADEAIPAPEFSYDLDTAPTLFVHGDADVWAAMNSVKAWEKMRAMGIQGELHTLATRPHCFQKAASPGTGSYTWMNRIWEFLTAKGFNK